MLMSEITERARIIRMVIFDVDGVLTDGRLFLGDDGMEYKAFNSHDGLGMKMLRNSGVAMAFITGRTSGVVAKRAESLGITQVYQGAEDKLPAFLALLESTGLSPEQCAFMGDDVVDLPPMRRCGLAVTVPSAPLLVKQHAHYETSRAAGSGAARELCELIMRAQGTFDTQLARYLV